MKASQFRGAFLYSTMSEQPQTSNRTASRWLDVSGQTLCILIPLVYWLSVMDKGLDGALSFLFIYFALGAWQLISCIAWLISTRWKAVSAGRKIYLGMLGFIVITTLPMWWQDVELAIVFTLVGTGVLAIFYFVLSIVEARREGKFSSPRETIQ